MITNFVFKTVPINSGVVEIPDEFFRDVEWAGSEDFECLIFVLDSNALRLLSPSREDELKEIIEDSDGFGVKVRLSKQSLRHRPRGAYRLTIPKDQLRWLWLTRKDRRVCVVLRRGVVEIWSMRGLDEKGFPEADGP